MNHDNEASEKLNNVEENVIRCDGKVLEEPSVSTENFISNVSQTDIKTKGLATKPAIRYAEKRRISTCQFADRVARLSVDHYKNTVPLEHRPTHTCIATIVAHCPKHRLHTLDADDIGLGTNEDTSDDLWVLSLGVGTKFLPESALRDERNNEESDGYGRRVRDMHAEVLARRAFRRQLMVEMQQDLLLSDEQRSRAVSFPFNHNILVRSSECMNDKDSRIRYKLRPGLTLHMYTSSAPCGNATLKRFCKMSKERFRNDLGPDEWPNGAHEPPPGHSIKLGEFSLLVKKDNSQFSNKEECGSKSPEQRRKAPSCTQVSTQVTSSSKYKVEMGSKSKRSRTDVDVTITNSSSQSENEKKESKQLRKSSGRRMKPWPATLSDDWVPPGTTIVGFRRKGSLHTCSDKICRWNYLGLQGSLLAGLLEEPLYMSTLTVGRKLSGPVCRRAICCRLDARCKQPIFLPHSLSKTKSDGEPTWTLDAGKMKYRVNHPTVMGTSVYMDTGVVDTSNNEERGQDVRFHSSYVWAWWKGLPKTSKGIEVAVNSNSSTSNGILEWIDGSTGRLAELSELIVFDKDSSKSPDVMNAPKVSTQALTSMFLRIYRIAGKHLHDENINDPINGAEEGSLPLNSNSKVTLKGLRDIKKVCSPLHEAFKDLLLTDHRVLSQWRRRSDDDE